MFARERSARGHMMSPSLAQRGEGGARGGSGESDLLSKANHGGYEAPQVAIDPASSRGADHPNHPALTVMLGPWVNST